MLTTNLERFNVVNNGNDIRPGQFHEYHRYEEDYSTESVDEVLIEWVQGTKALVIFEDNDMKIVDIFDLNPNQIL